MKKVYKTVISFILAISFLSVNMVALAATGDADTYAGYLKSGWSWNASSNSVNYPSGASTSWNRILIDSLKDMLLDHISERLPYATGWLLTNSNSSPSIPSASSGSWYAYVMYGLHYIERNTYGNGLLLTNIKESLLTYYNGLVTRINAANTDITSAVNTFASANHSDITSFASANHTDITSFASANHTDLANIYDTVGIRGTSANSIVADTNFMSDTFASLWSTWERSGYYWNCDFAPGVTNNNWFSEVLNMLQSSSVLSQSVNVNSAGGFTAPVGSGSYPLVVASSPISRIYRELWFNSTDNGSKWDVINSSGNSDNNTNVYRNILYDVGMLKRVLATEEDLELRNQQSDNVTAVTDNFLSGQSSGSSVGSADFSGISDGLGSVTGLFASPVGIGSTSDAVNGAFSSQSGFSFFTSACANDLDTVGDGNRRLRSSKNNSGNEIVTHYYEDNQSLINEWLEAHANDKSSD